MATFKAVIRAHHQRRDGKYPVSIRLTHNRQSVYLPTGLYVSKKQINSKHYELKDQFVIERTNQTIRQYETALLAIATDELLSMSATELSNVVCSRYKDIEFISFAEELLLEDSYKVRSLGTVIGIIKDKMNCPSILLGHIDEIFVKQFLRCVDSIKLPASKRLGETRTKSYSARTKNGFITDFHSAYKRALENVGYENRKRYSDPFVDIKYYKGEASKVASASVVDIRRFFALRCETNIQKVAHDILFMCFCLGGMNLGDILLLKKSAYDSKTNRITYRRNKIKDNRADGGITSIRVEPEIKELFDKYSSLSNDEYLFNFNNLRFEKSTSRNFGMTIDRICKLYDMPHLTPYMFRHSVATIARNKCGCSKDDVGMLLNHRGPTTVDDAYIDDDWSIVDRTNRLVLDYVFHSDKE